MIYRGCLRAGFNVICWVLGCAAHTLTLDEKIGQLFIIPACQLRGEDHLEDLQKLIHEYKVGGILLKQGTADGQRALISSLQKISPIPLLCVQDGEWGVSMRLSDVIAFPRNLTLGAVQDLSLLYALGQEIGRQCQLVGTHLNTAPVVDVNTNPFNPIIHTRSFGENPLQVALRAMMLMRGMQSMGVMACAKHFPGHGSSSVDSHVDLPFITEPAPRLHHTELLPFRFLVQSGVDAIMSAHLYVNALAEQGLLPATFSKKIITKLLHEDMGFTGLTITDALNMKALAKSYTPAEIALRAINAGHDMLLYGDHIAPNIDQILQNDIPEAFLALKNAVQTGEVAESAIDQHVYKILHVKDALGLFQNSSCAKIEDLQNKINTQEAYALKERLFQEAVTVLCNDNILPLHPKPTAVIEWGSSPFFKQALEETLPIETISLEDPHLFTRLEEYSSAVLSLSNFPSQRSHFEVESNEEALLHALSASGIPIVAVIFDSPYVLLKLPSFTALVLAYENQKEAQEAAAEVLLGKLQPKGKLPVNLLPHFPLGTGLSW